MKDMREDYQLNDLWLICLKGNTYIGQIVFLETLDVIVRIAELMNLMNKMK